MVLNLLPESLFIILILIHSLWVLYLVILVEAYLHHRIQALAIWDISYHNVHRTLHHDEKLQGRLIALLDQDGLAGNLDELYSATEVMNQLPLKVTQNRLKERNLHQEATNILQIIY